MVKSICGVILVSDNPQRLAEFYGKVLDVDFEREEHGGLAPHFGVDIGEVHFGIHPPANFSRTDAGRASAVVAFNVDDLELPVARLAELDAEQVQPPHDEGFGQVTSYRDPDGNTFELVALDYDFAEKGD